MKNKKTINTGIAALATGALAIGGVNSNANALDLFEINDLGTAGELRPQLLSNGSDLVFHNNADVELKCGEGKCGEGKCGEGKSEKAEDKKDDKKKEAKKEEAKKEDKSSEHKCGEGKCGEGKCGTH
jgi:uncharacterized low-complexity protein